ncbi:MAG: hypothetical protein ACUVQQ_02875 [Thermogutta sp.]
MVSRLCSSLLVLTAFSFTARTQAGPFDPAAGQPGSHAVHMASIDFQGWATGWKDYVVGADVTGAWQTPEKALGPAVGTSFDIVGLGNGGSIVLTFDRPITDGPGWDFAVFENSFSDTFLELAYVEVSTNGNDYFRFPNQSLTPSPVSAFGAVDPTNIDGLAGKYRQGWGTPFDLNVLTGISPLLDVNWIPFVRIVDIIGDGSFLDSFGRPIYDPHRTVGSGGFDLDAIGVRYFAATQAVPEPASACLLLASLPLIRLWRRRRKTAA